MHFVRFVNVDNMAKIVNNIELVPTKNLDDSILKKARFLISPYRDVQKLWQRIVTHLLYYQNTYLAIILILFLLAR